MECLSTLYSNNASLIAAGRSQHQAELWFILVSAIETIQKQDFFLDIMHLSIP